MKNREEKNGEGKKSYRPEGHGGASNSPSHRHKDLAGGFTPLEIGIMQYVYILRSTKDGKWYTGCTEDLRKRFSDHNDGKVPSTKGRGPFELIYYEASLSAEDAFAREKYLKSRMGKRYLKNRLKRFLSR